jgi:hypothetical protein
MWRPHLPRIRGILIDGDVTEILRGADEVKDAHGRMVTEHSANRTRGSRASTLVYSRNRLPRWMVSAAVSSGYGHMWAASESCWFEWVARWRCSRVLEEGMAKVDKMTQSRTGLP